MKKEIWRKNWLESIGELTDLNLQRMSWLDISNSNPHWSYVEFRCCYFDDTLCKKEYEKYIETNFVEIKEYSIIQDWHNALMNYKSPNGDDYNHEEILDDLRWIAIITKGELLRKGLREILSQNEFSILNSSLDYYRQTKKITNG